MCSLKNVLKIIAKKRADRENETLWLQSAPAMYGQGKTILMAIMRFVKVVPLHPAK